MRISEIVNTVKAYQALGMMVGKRAVEGAMAIQTGLDTGGHQVEEPEESYDVAGDKYAVGDTVDLSTYGKTPVEDAVETSRDDSLGAIIESFRRERQVVNYTMPGIAGVTGPMNMTYEVEQAYHIIEFVPRSQLDALA